MEEEKVEGETTENTTTEVETETKVEEETKVDASKELEAKNRQLFERTKKAEKAQKELTEEVERLKKVPKTDSALNVEDYIDISASLEGLDQREKEKLARDHKLTGKPLSEIRKDEDFILWQTAYRAKVEKEKALNPSTRQTDTTKPKTYEETLEELHSKSNENPFVVTPEREAQAEKEGLWKSPQKRKEIIPLSRG